MTKIFIPGVLYSLLAAVGVWAVDYFTGTGAGAHWPYAAILLAAIPTVIKLFSVATSPSEPASQARGMNGEQPEAPPSKLTRFLLG